jgi:ferric-dicitrate binding protein FerR (iron transport regulator)
MTTEELQELLAKYLAEELDDTDFPRFWEALRTPEHAAVLQEVMEQVWNNPAYHHLAGDSARQRVWTQLNPVRQKEMTIKHRSWWAAAACILLLGTGTGIFFSLQKKAPVIVHQVPAGGKEDVLPGNNKATLTLGDGSIVSLDSTGNQVIQQGNTAIRQNKGALEYHTPGANAGISYNTLTTPRGGQFQVLLPDGTKVWLNAASSIRYPTAFAGNERKVEVTGEAYFEVAANATAPFRVAIGNRAAVEVLGTHFNINAYPEESSVQTTLLEGRVKVNAALLLPGEQASLDAAGKISIKKEVDVAQVIAWKDGWFQFHLSSLPDVMRQISRWYDVEVIYQGNIPGKSFEGRIQRDLTLTQMLKILEKNQVHFKLTGRKIEVLPGNDTD